MISDELARIQKELKAPKGNYNNFGKYKYRSCEDILEAVKPLLGSTALMLNDDLVMVGTRYYVKATALLKNGEEQIHTIAYAREAEDKKGMDAAQITGSASSYARKYALSGLFAIDDEKDADTQKPEEGRTEHRQEQKIASLPPSGPKNSPSGVTPAQLSYLEKLYGETLRTICVDTYVKEPRALTKDEASKLIENGINKEFQK